MWLKRSGRSEEYHHSPSPSEPDYSKIFSAFDEDKSLIDVVKQGLCDPDKAVELWNKYEELKDKTLEIKEKPRLEERIGELEEKLAAMERNLDLILDITNHGNWVKENCEHYKDGYCRGIYWNLKPKKSFFLKSIEEEGKWYIDPDVRNCALCPKNTNSNFASKEKIENLELHISLLKGNIAYLKNNICPYCKQPAVVLLARCQYCGAGLEKRLSP